jgi:hypothetical protein
MARLLSRLDFLFSLYILKRVIVFFLVLSVLIVCIFCTFKSGSVMQGSIGIRINL